MKTASVVIIGDEILSGKFVDENSPYLIRRLRELGVRVRRVAVISDEQDEIGDEVRRCSEASDWVFTTGGVGPTHDDITMESIAAGFGVPAVRHPELEQVLRDHIRGEVNEAALRMALVPQGAELLWAGGLTFPLVVFRNVHILPGVPSILKLKFEAVAERFRGAQLVTGRVVTCERETAIAARLEDAVARFPGVSIGSYPRFEDGPRHVIVTLEGADPSLVAACQLWLEQRLKPLDAL
jgi:molybdenum cofactor synthesis domain-containing protein